MLQPFLSEYYNLIQNYPTTLSKSQELTSRIASTVYCLSTGLLLIPQRLLKFGDETLASILTLERDHAQKAVVHLYMSALDPLIFLSLGILGLRSPLKAKELSKKIENFVLEQEFYFRPNFDTFLVRPLQAAILSPFVGITYSYTFLCIAINKYIISLFDNDPVRQRDLAKAELDNVVTYLCYGFKGLFIEEERKYIQITTF